MNVLRQLNCRKPLFSQEHDPGEVKNSFAPASDSALLLINGATTHSPGAHGRDRRRLSFRKHSEEYTTVISESVLTFPQNAVDVLDLAQMMAARSHNNGSCLEMRRFVCET